MTFLSILSLCGLNLFVGLRKTLSMTDEENISTLWNSETDWGEKLAAKWVHFTPKEFSYYNNVAYKNRTQKRFVGDYSISGHISPFSWRTWKSEV